MKKKHQMPVADIDSRIIEVRGQKVILDSELARIYGVPTKALNQAVKRNARRFPSDFLFSLDAGEFQDLQSSPTAAGSHLRSQIVTSKGKRGGRRYLPFAFTEHGAIMAANVLNSRRAIDMSVFVV